MKIDSRVRELLRKRQSAQRLWESQTRTLSGVSPLEPGCLLSLAMGEGACPVLAVLSRHPDESNWVFAVPVDDGPFVGSADVRASGPDSQACWVLHCGCGLWVSEHALRTASLTWSLIGRLAGEDLERARVKVRQLVAGRVLASHEQLEADALPEYREWLVAARQARQRLLARLEGREISIDFRTRADSTEELPLAAAGERLGTRIARLFASGRAETVDLASRCLLQGHLWASAGARGVSLVCLSPGTRQPPTIRCVAASGRPAKVRWVADRTSSGWRSRSPLPWSKGLVRLVVGEDPAITVVMSRPAPNPRAKKAKCDRQGSRRVPSER